MADGGTIQSKEPFQLSDLRDRWDGVSVTLFLDREALQFEDQKSAQTTR